MQEMALSGKSVTVQPKAYKVHIHLLRHIIDEHVQLSELPHYNKYDMLNNDLLTIPLFCQINLQQHNVLNLPFGIFCITLPVAPLQVNMMAIEQLGGNRVLVSCLVQKFWNPKQSKPPKSQ
jgi:hypothetical protein